MDEREKSEEGERERVTTKDEKEANDTHIHNLILGLSLSLTETRKAVPSVDLTYESNESFTRNALAERNQSKGEEGEERDARY